MAEQVEAEFTSNGGHVDPAATTRARASTLSGVIFGGSSCQLRTRGLERQLSQPRPELERVTTGRAFHLRLLIGGDSELDHFFLARDFGFAPRSYHAAECTDNVRALSSQERA